MLRHVSSPTTHNFKFSGDHLPLLLGNNIATFLDTKADGFNVSAVSQLKQFEVKPHIFMGCFFFSPLPRPLRSANKLKRTRFLSLLGPGETGSKGKWKTKAIHEVSRLKTGKEFGIQWQDKSRSAAPSSTSFYKSTNSKDSRRSLIKFKPNG